jgi:SAM-dependent methyltransferase
LVYGKLNQITEFERLDMASSRSKKDIDTYYKENYSKVFSSGKVGGVWRIIHIQMEKPFRKANSSLVLEIGAGAGEHITFVKDNFSEYFQTDIDTTNLTFSKNWGGGVVTQQQDATKLTYLDSTFERSIVTCVLVHLFEPELAISELKRVTKNNGYISIYVPCEPGLVLRLAQKYITERKMKKLGIVNPRSLHFTEHRGNFYSLDFFIRDTFSGSKIERKFYPFRLPFMNLNLYAVYQIRLLKS